MSGDTTCINKNFVCRSLFNIQPYPCICIFRITGIRWSGCGHSHLPQAVAVACPSKAPAVKHFWLERRWVPIQLLSRMSCQRNVTFALSRVEYIFPPTPFQPRFRVELQWLGQSPQNNYPWVRITAILTPLFGTQCHITSEW